MQACCIGRSCLPEPGDAAERSRALILVMEGSSFVVRHSLQCIMQPNSASLEMEVTRQWQTIILLP